MKTLIFNGSPRKNGNTAQLVADLQKKLSGEVKVVTAYACDVKPCIDCRYCWKNPGCAIHDGMQEIYDDIQEADNIVIASPTYFTELSGQLLAVMSRLQTYWCAKYLRKEEPVQKKKRGGIIIVRGGAGQLAKGISTAKVLLGDMNAADIAGIVFADGSDTTPAVTRDDIQEAMTDLAGALNEER
ncbi:flavodoxin family protein [Oscillospiraceae bacterium WX1]